MNRPKLGTVLLAALGLAIIVVAVLTQHKPKDLVNCLSANGQTVLTNEQKDILFKYSKNFPNESEFSIAIMEGDSVGYIGVKRQDDSLFFVSDSDKIFDIGSITKTFTGIILAKMVQEGVVDLNEPIKNLLPVKLHQSSKNGKEITIVDLADHTSGLPRDIDNAGSISNRSNDIVKLYDYLSNRCVLSSTPGEKRSYSNLGYAILAHILTLVSHKSFQELVAETITSPLDMRNTFVHISESTRRNLVDGRDPHGKVVEYSDPDDVSVGAGGLKSNAVDLVKYISACINDTSYITLAEQPTFVEDEHGNSCLGWGFYRYNGMDFYGAFGSTPGYSCGVIFEKTTQIGLVFLSNVSGFLSAEGDYIPKMCRELHGSIFYPKLDKSKS